MAKIKLKKVRDFGEVLGDTFAFVGQNFNPLLKIFLFLVAPVAIFTSIFAGYVQNELVGNLAVYNEALLDGDIDNPFEMLSSLFSGYYFVNVLLSLITYSIVAAAIFTYLKKYEESENGEVGMKQITNGLLMKIVTLSLFMVMASLIYFFGTLMFIIPGVFLMIATSLYQNVYIVEGKGFVQAFKRSMQLVKGHWWMTLSLYATIGVLVSVILGIVQLLFALLLGAGSSLVTQEPSTALAVVTGIATFCGYFFNFIFWVLIGIWYYSLVEIKDGTSAFEKINQIGNTHTQEEIDRMFR